MNKYNNRADKQITVYQLFFCLFCFHFIHTVDFLISFSGKHPLEEYLVKSAQLIYLMNTLMLVRKRLNPALKVEGVVLTMYDSRTNLSEQVAEEVRRYFREHLFKTTIPRNVRLSEAPSHGQPIHLYDPRSTGAKAYLDLAKELLRGI